MELCRVKLFKKVYKELQNAVLVYLMISEGQRNDINYEIPVLEQTNIEGILVIAGRGYDSYALIDYIYESGGEPMILTKKCQM